MEKLTMDDEQRLLSRMFNCDELDFGKVDERIGPKMFANRLHGEIYEAMCDLLRQGKSLCASEIHERICENRKRRQLDYIRELQEHYEGDNIFCYTDLVVGLFFERQSNPSPKDAHSTN